MNIDLELTCGQAERLPTANTYHLLKTCWHFQPLRLLWSECTSCVVCLIMQDEQVISNETFLKLNKHIRR